MTLLDYFAAKAMQSFIISNTDGYLRGEYEGSATTPSVIATDAYYQAKAMLEARQDFLKGNI